MTTTSPDTRIAEKAPDYRKMALAKCHANEKHAASEQQTLAASVCSAAHELAVYAAEAALWGGALMHRAGYVGSEIDALHRAADYIVCVPGQIRQAVEAEREACADLVDDRLQAAAIRARGDTK